MKMSDIPTKSKPTHTLYAVQGKDEKSHWTRIGAAWAHRDGQGFSIKLDVVPLSGRIQMRIATQEAEGGAR
jgi:hypothetical protein